MSGVTRRFTTLRGWRAGVAILSLGALAGCSSMDDFTGENITRVTSSGLSMLTGARPAEERNAEIEVRARSPLVVPPNYNLRPPETTEQEDARLGTNWPTDPDVQAREMAALESAREAAVEEKIRRDGVGRSRALTNEELNASMRPAGYTPRRPLRPRAEHEYVMTPEELLRRHRERAQDEAGAGEAQTVQPAGESAGSQQVQEASTEASAPPPKKNRSLFDRLVFWD